MCVFQWGKSRLSTNVDFKSTGNITGNNTVHISQTRCAVAAMGSFKINLIFLCNSCPEIKKDKIERVASTQTSSGFYLRAELSIR